MRKIKINGKSYELLPDNQRRYDGYYYRGEITDRSPVDTRVIGHVVEEKTKIAVCRKDNKVLRKAVYVGTGVAGVAVLCFSVLVIGFDVDVPHWELSRNGDDIVGELDTGIRKESRKFSYSQYVTYDGTDVLLFVTSKNGGEISLTIDGVSSEYVPVDQAYSIPMQLNLGAEQITQGILKLKHGDSVEEFPIVVEHLNTTKPDIAMGDISDKEFAQEQWSETLTSGESMLKETTSEDDENITGTTEADFSAFPVIEPKGWKDEERADETAVTEEE